MVIGSMIASLIELETPISFGETFVLQDVLDDLLPQMLSLAATFIMYWLIRKKVPMGWLLTICIVGGVVFNVLGILN